MGSFVSRKKSKNITIVQAQEQTMSHSHEGEPQKFASIQPDHPEIVIDDHEKLIAKEQVENDSIGSKSSSCSSSWSSEKSSLRGEERSRDNSDSEEDEVDDSDVESENSGAKEKPDVPLETKPNEKIETVATHQDKPVREPVELDREPEEPEPEVTDNLSHEEKVSRCMMGDLDLVYPQNARIVRIFTSSTFTDTSIERNTLMERVYPRIKQHCQESGYEFQVVDMRWGVRDEATDDHMTSELCMRELRACQQLSTGPNFITFLGQKYGYRPFPPKIPVREFEKLLSAVVDKSDEELLRHWFRRDDNSVPAEYLLQPITDLLPDYRNYDDNELRKKASADWWTAFERMQVVLREASDKTLSKKGRQKYHMSVTEDEIRRGIITARDQTKHCYWFKRVINGLHDNLSNQNTDKFIDKVWGSSDIDAEAQNLLNTLREQDLPRVLPQGNVTHYDVMWSDNGIDPVSSTEHAQYIEKLCEDFHDVLTGMIDTGVQDRESNRKEDALEDELFQHGSFCRTKCASFYGREEYLREVKSVLLKERVVVIHGESGCGKTSIMAKIAWDVRSWLSEKKKCNPCAVVRFIGTSPDSSSIRLLLRSICEQLQRVTNKNDSIPQGMKELTKFFRKCLKQSASPTRPIVLVLDSLDQLSDDFGARELDWLKKLPPAHAYLVLSTLPGEQYGCFPRLEDMYSSNCLLEVPAMQHDTAGQILNNWLEAAHRTLQPEQLSKIIASFKLCPLPLYLKLAFDEACRWKSYTPSEDAVLAVNVKEMINALLDRVERVHGNILVSHALGYITASKSGLSEPELEDLLSLDDEVLNDVYQYWTPPVRRLPPLLWIRIRADIRDYLIDRGADGVRVSAWYHRQFVEVAHERYLSEDEKTKFHSHLADYYLGTRTDGNKKPFTNKQGEDQSIDRFVARQPLMFDTSDRAPRFNLRKLSELPYHLIQAGNEKTLKEEALCNFEFLLAKLRALSVESILQEFESALAVFPRDQDLKLLKKCFSLSMHALRAEPKQLATQLLGRMLSYSRDTSYPYLVKLLQQARVGPVPCFIPNQQCLTSPSGSLMHSIDAEEFRGGIEYVNISPDGKTVVTSHRGSEGLCILYFDINTARRTRKVCFTKPSGINTAWCARMSDLNTNRFIAAGSSDEVFLINTKSGKALQTFKPISDSSAWFRTLPPVSFADEDRLVVALGDKALKVYNTGTGEEVHSIPVDGIDPEKSFGTVHARGKEAAYCVQEQSTVHFIDLETGQEIRTVEVELLPPDYGVYETEKRTPFVVELKLGVQDQLMAMSSERNDLVVYNSKTGKFIQRPEKFGIDQHSHLQITDDCKYAISTKSYEMYQWDLQTGKSKALAKIQPVFGLYVRSNHLVMTVSSDGLLRIYDTSRGISEEDTKDGSVTDGYPDTVWAAYVATDNRHVITMCTVQTMPQICVWDAALGVKVRTIKSYIFPYPLKMISATVGVGYMNEPQPSDTKFCHYKMFDFEAGRVLGVLQGKASKRLNAFAALGDGRVVGLSRGRRNLKIWDTKSLKVVEQLKAGQKHRFEGLLASGDGSTVVCTQVSTFDELEEETTPLVVFNLRTRKTFDVKIEGEKLNFDVPPSITHNGEYLLHNLKSDPGAVIWDLTYGTMLQKLEAENWVQSLAISSMSMRAVTSESGGEIKIWDIESGDLLHSAQSSDINNIFLSEDGLTIITTDEKAYEPTDFRAWNLRTAACIATYTVDDSPFIIIKLGDGVLVLPPATLTPYVLRLYIPRGTQGVAGEAGLSAYGEYKFLEELKGWSDPPDPDDVDDDDDDDTGDVG